MMQVLRSRLICWGTALISEAEVSNAITFLADSFTNHQIIRGLSGEIDVRTIKNLGSAKGAFKNDEEEITCSWIFPIDVCSLNTCSFALQNLGQIIRRSLTIVGDGRADVL